jgi:trehalose 6-phosphate phosphatase
VSSEQGRQAVAGSALLEPFLAVPERAALLTDVDGTLAPIVERPEAAAVPAPATDALRKLSERFALVGCVSGRRAEEARRLVGLDELAYAGNHGMEVLWPGADGAGLAAAVAGQRQRVREFVARLGDGGLAGLRLEDKDSILALHWRGADDEAGAEARAGEIARAAEADGLAVHWGRKVLELRPPVAIGKDVAVAELLSRARPRHAIYAGDDRTDLDAFAGLRELLAEGALESAVCVGVLSEEGPPELAPESDLTVGGPAGWLEILAALAE